MTAKPKTLKSITAYAEVDEHRQTGNVELYGFAGWLKGEDRIVASLTPAAARLLAEKLLTVARQVER
jgi:hypothetical protein